MSVLLYFGRIPDFPLNYSLYNTKIVHNLLSSHLKQKQHDMKIINLSENNSILNSFIAEMHEQYPQYQWNENKGYPTKVHREAIAQYGITPYHRLTYGGVKEFIQKK